MVIRDNDKGSLVEKLTNLASLSSDRPSKQNGEAVRVEYASGNDIDKDPSTVTVHLDNADSQNHIDIESTKEETGAAEIICEPGRNSHCYCAELESQLKHIETNVNFLMNHFETSAVKEFISSCGINSCQTEKYRLMHDLEAANALVKELKAKIDHLENEKSSLVTAIRIIQEDNNAQVNQNSKNNPWFKVTQKTKKAKRPQNRNSPRVRKWIITSLRQTYMLKNKVNSLKYNLIKQNLTTLTIREQIIALKMPKNQILLML